jgi:Xaa-Pro aminopeptidase
MYCLPFALRFPTFQLSGLALVVWFFASLLDVTAQAPGVSYPFEIHEKEGLLRERYAERRRHVLSTMPDSAVAVFFAADVRNRQGDVDYTYRQSNDLLYLTGVSAPGAILVLVPAGVQIHQYDTTRYREVLFLPERTVQSEVWTGVKPGPVEAEQYYGMAKALPIKQWESLSDELLRRSTTLYVGQWPTASVYNPFTGEKISIADTVRQSLKQKYPHLSVRSSQSVLTAMREIKDDDEITLMQKAVDITVAGFLETLRQAQPGMAEYELEAVMEQTFFRLGAHDVGYPSIVGSGPNSCLLHYTDNRRMTERGDLVLMDCGAEYFGYTADITRTFPVNGTFSTEQKLLYNIVREAQDSAFAVCVPGSDWRLPHSKAVSVIRRRLLEEQIIKEPEDYLWYFMHGTSHYLGLDVHDVGTYKKLSAGVVLTVEPGIYIPKGSPCDPKWWNIGIRIEDNVLVTKDGPVILSKDLPRSTGEIERLMQRSRK